MSGYQFKGISLYDLRGNRKYLNGEERKRFYAAIQSLNVEDYLFAALLLWTGARFSEIYNLQKIQIDIHEEKVVIETLKRRQSGIYRCVPIPLSLVRSLKSKIEQLEPQQHLFTASKRTYARRIKRIMCEASINGTQACPKGLRHSYAINAISNGVPLTLIKKWMGHASIQTTEIYLDIVGIEERVFAKRMWNGESKMI